MQLIIFVIFLLSLVVHYTLRRKIVSYSRIPLQSGLTGAQVAAKMLSYYGIDDVKVVSTSGKLTDNYNPFEKTVNLSNDVFYGMNAASVAVAAHECGHAVQHAKGYTFLQLRSVMVPVVSFTARFVTLLLIAGMVMIEKTTLPLEIGIGLFAFTTLFSFITLPVEFDASKRALAWINHQGVVTSGEYKIAKEALSWAAMTYVLAALGSLAELLRLISILNQRRNEGGS